MKHLTTADLRAGLNAIGELTVKAKDAAQAAAILDRYRAEIADFDKADAAEPAAEPKAKTDLVPTNGKDHAPETPTA